MGQGFEIINDKGEVQVTSEAPLLTFDTSYDISGRTNVPAKMIALAPTMGGQRVNWSWGFQKDYSTFVGQGYAFTFDYGMPPESIANYGIEVFDAAGKLTFSSGQRAMRIMQQVSIPDVRARGNLDRIWSTPLAGGGQMLAILFNKQAIWQSGSRAMTVGVYLDDNSNVCLGQAVALDDRYIVDGLIGRFSIDFLVVEVSGYFRPI